MEVLRFKYKPRLGLFLILIAIFLVINIYVLMAAQQPVDNRTLVRLMEQLNLDAGVLLTVLGWAGILFSVAAAGALYWTATLGDRFVEIGAGRIRAPASNLSKNIVEIPVADVKNVNVQNIQSTRIITVQHAKGKVQFVSMMFPEKGAFDELIRALKTIDDHNNTLKDTADS